MKINIDLLNSEFSYVWAELTDSQRIELIKILIYTAPNSQEFCDKTIKELKKLKDKLD